MPHRRALCCTLLVSCALLASQASAADLLVDGTTFTLSGERGFDTVEVVNGGVILVDPFDGGPDTGWLHIKASVVIIDATSSINADEAGFRGRTSRSGEGPGGARSASYPGGGGYGAYGDWGYLHCYMSTHRGRRYGRSFSDAILMGSAGGGGSWDPGGNGGGAVRIDTGRIVMEGEITAHGQDGGDAGGGSGGGSGGGILIMADSGIVSGYLGAHGGQVSGHGGYSGSAGGGSGGRIKVFGQFLSAGGMVAEVDGGDGACSYNSPQDGTAVFKRIDTDRDGDGWLIVDGDCDDWNATVHPGATELLDSLDNDCDGTVD